MVATCLQHTGSFYEYSEVMSNVVKRMNFSEVVAMTIIRLLYFMVENLGTRVASGQL